MKALVLFGSQSDSPLYEKLISQLKSNSIYTEFHILSAHRTPEELNRCLESVNYDIVIAGAGLAAHLPGVVASKTLKPVFGIPVDSIMEGVDAFASILQMPSGVPVLSCFPCDVESVLSFIKQLADFRNNLRKEMFTKKSIVVNIEENLLREKSIQKSLSEIKQFEDHFEVDVLISTNSDFKVESQTLVQSINIVNLSIENGSPETGLLLPTLIPGSLPIMVPFMDYHTSQKAVSMMTLFQKVKLFRGIWVGVNNIKNALLASIQLSNVSGAHNKKLRTYKRIQVKPEIRSFPHIIHYGSVKNLRGETGDNSLIFEFSDRYSVFDWGEMPDHLENKGDSLAMMSDMIFRILDDPAGWRSFCREHPNMTYEFTFASLLDDLCERGLKSHNMGLVNKDLSPVSPAYRSNLLKVRLVDVHRPTVVRSAGGIEYDYSVYKNKPTNSLVPLEIIFRFAVPSGSSLIKRLKKDECSAYIRDLGLVRVPEYGDIFDSPIIEFSTKLEPTDRYLSYQEAKSIAGLSDDEFGKLVSLTKVLSYRLKSIFGAASIELMDGKFEFAFDENRDFILVDAIGPDELRLLRDGVQLSKEILRQYYKGSSWLEYVEKSKLDASKLGIGRWQDICREKYGFEPDLLDKKLKLLVENVYMSLTNLIAERYFATTPFHDLLSLPDLIGSLKNIGVSSENGL